MNICIERIDVLIETSINRERQSIKVSHQKNSPQSSNINIK